MDDDEEVPHSWDVLVPAAAAVPVLAPREKATLAQQPLPKGRQGEYRAPQGGVVWLWRRDSQGYHALTIKEGPSTTSQKKSTSFPLLRDTAR